MLGSVRVLTLPSPWWDIVHCIRNTAGASVHIYSLNVVGSSLDHAVNDMTSVHQLEKVI